MADIAALGLKIDGVAGVVSTKDALTGLTSAAEDADKAVEGLGETSKTTGKALDEITESTKRTEKAVDKLDKGSKKVNRELSTSGKTARSSSVAKKDLAQASIEAGRGAQILSEESKKANREILATATSSETSSGSMYGLAGAAKAAGAALGAAFTVKAIASYADTWSDLSSQIKVGLPEHENVADVMARIADISRMTYSSLELTADAFARNSSTLSALGKTTKEQLDYTEALNNALVVSGAKGQNAQIVQDSLSRAMAEGTLRGIELSNILNYGSKVADLLAKELKVNRNELRGLAKDGLITSEVINNALVNNMEELARLAETMPATLGDGFTLIRNSVLESVGVFDQHNKISEELAEKLVSIADAIRDTNFTEYSNAIQGAAVATAAYVLAINAVPISLGVAAAAKTTYNALTLKSTRTKLAEINATRQQNIATAAAAKEELIYLRALQASLSAQLKSNLGTAAAGPLRAQLAANTRALTAAQEAYTRSTAAASNATRLAGASMALLGGPVGAIMLAVGALAYFVTRAEEAESATELLSKSIDGLNVRQANAEIVKLGRALSDQKKEVADLAKEMDRLRHMEWLESLGRNPNTVALQVIREQIMLVDGQMFEAEKTAADLEAQIKKLEGISNPVKEVTEGVKEASEEFKKLSATLNERLLLIGATTEAEKLARRISAGYVEGLIEGEGEILIGLQKEIDARNELEQAAKKSDEDRKKRAEQAAASEKTRLENIDKEISAIERAAIVWKMSAEEIKLYDLRVQGASESQLEYAGTLLATAAEFEQVKKSQEAYSNLLGDLRTKEEILTDQVRERVAVMREMAGLTDAQIADTSSRIAGDAFEKAPEYKGLAPEVGGSWGELNKISDAEAELNDWYSKQLELLDAYRQEELLQKEHWDQQELDLHQKHQEELEKIEQARRYAKLSANEEFFGTMADTAKHFFGEQSDLYIAAFAMEKAYASAKALMNVPSTYSNAYNAVVGTPIIGPYIAPVVGTAAAAVQVAQAAKISGMTMKGFQRGGYTGDVGVSDVAGIVHGQEYVFDAESTKRIGRDNLESMRRGSDPKSESRGVVVNIHNAPEGTRVEESTGQNNEQMIDVWLADFNSDGRTAGAVQAKFGLTARGR